MGSNLREHVPLLVLCLALSVLLGSDAVMTGASPNPGWVIEIVDSGISGAGWFSSIALDENDRPHISYSDLTNYDLKYARWDGNSWRVETVDSEGNVGLHTSIALDDNDRPHISYCNNLNLKCPMKGCLMYAHWVWGEVPEGEEGAGTPIAYIAVGAAVIAAVILALVFYSKLGKQDFYSKLGAESKSRTLSETDLTFPPNC